jgi:transcriptional regulator with GAF, ATPase, and Fis domain
MRALIARVERLAAVDTTVLVQGETGTGKERVAEALHLASRRAQNPLVVVDCGAIAGTLIESELFGHERGAFTGALARNAGAFERAHGGTVFLDEVGELPLDLQPKLLRAIEAHEVRRLGGDRPIAFDARIIAATNRDLAVEVGKGRFREDLYYRLAVVTLSVPPLRERLDDVPLLAVHILREMGVDPAACLTAESLARLTAHDWPGNVRELRNTIERAVALMEPVSLTDEGAAPPVESVRAPRIDLEVPLRIGKQRLIDQYERAYVLSMLDATDGNVSEAARRAGMDRMSIHRIIARHKLRGDGGGQEK